MRFSFIAIALIIQGFFATSAALADQPQEANDVKKLLAGVWEIEEGVNQGEEIPEDEIEGTSMVINADTIITYDKDKKEKYRATFTIDTTKEPICIDMVTYMKGRPPMKSVGILQFEDDDEFELCYALPGFDRPTKFESPKDSKIMLFECERED